MRILRIETLYERYWRQYYLQHPGLAARTYSEQQGAIFSDFFAEADSYRYYFTRMGHEWEEINPNVLPLQKSWAREHPVDWAETDCIRWLPVEQVRWFRPEIVFVGNWSLFSGQWAREIKEQCPSVRLCVLWCASPVYDPESLRGYDAVLTSSLAMLQDFRRDGLRCELLRHAFDPRVLEHLDPKQGKSIGLSFVGSLNQGDGMHADRTEFISQLVETEDLALYCPRDAGNRARRLLKALVDGVSESVRRVAPPRRMPGVASGDRRANLTKFWRQYQARERLISGSRGEVFGLDMYRTLDRSRITLNVHIDVAGRFSGNRRLFEATGVGTCLLTDDKEDLPSIFEPDREVVIFKSIAECVEKARWLGGNPSASAEIGQAGQRRTLKHHSYERRTEELADIFRQMLRERQCTSN